MYSKIDLDKIYNSGQCFRWEKYENIYTSQDKLDIHCNKYMIPLNEESLTLSYDRNELVINPHNKLYETYLDLDFDYSKVNEILQDENPKFAELFHSLMGIFILNQPFFETCISFIISQNNNIPKIKTTIKRICGGDSNRFPNASELLESLNKDNFSLGYRKDYIINFCIDYLNGDFNDLENLSLYECYQINRDVECADTSDIIERLCSIRGIGPKVASCIALFTLGCKDAVPRDVWVKRIEERYNIKWNERYAGYQQQMLFYAIRNHMI